MPIPANWKKASIPDAEPENTGVNAVVFYQYTGPTDEFDLSSNPVYARFRLFYDRDKYSTVPTVLVNATSDDFDASGSEYDELGDNYSFKFNPSGNAQKDAGVIASKIKMILGNLAKDIKKYDPPIDPWDVSGLDVSDKHDYRSEENRLGDPWGRGNPRGKR